MLITVDKNNKEEIEKAKKKPIITEPIVVLVNENTASASEIFASALKEHNKATIVAKYYDKDNIPSTEDLVLDIKYFADLRKFIIKIEKMFI